MHLRRALLPAILLAALPALAGCLESADAPQAGVLDPTPTSAPADAPPGEPEGEGDNDDDTGAPPADLPFRTLDEGGQTGIASEEAVVVETRDAWADFWQEHTSHRTDDVPRPDVDFANERVYAAFIGQKPNGCWAVRVENVTSDEGAGTTVHVTTYRPPPGAMCPMAMTRPYHVVALARDGGPIATAHTTREGPPPAD